MEITWLGHSSFRIRSGNTALLMDPLPEDTGLSVTPQQTQANVVTASGSAAPPSSSGDDEKAPIFISGPGEYEASGLHIRGIRTSRFAPEAERPAWNTVFAVEIEGMVLCHLGDPDRLLTAREIEELASPHVLLLPVGSREGLSAADAVELVSRISPRIVVPMLFAHPGNKTDLRELGPFLQELGAKEPEAQTRLTVTRATLPEETQVMLLTPAATML